MAISIGIGAHGLAVEGGVVVPALLETWRYRRFWWTYFDVNALAAERRLASISAADRAEVARDRTPISIYR